MRVISVQGRRHRRFRKLNGEAERLKRFIIKVAGTVWRSRGMDETRTAMNLRSMGFRPIDRLD